MSVCFLQLAAVFVLTNGFGRAEVDSLGARVLSYRPAGQEEVFFRLEKPCPPEKWQHGGVPICWPWFGQNGDPGTPSHGLVRSRTWRLVAREDGVRSSSAHLVLEEPGDWRLDYTVTLSDSLTLKLEMQNLGTTRFVVTTGLHPYFRISDLEKVQVDTPDGAIRCFPGMDGGRRLGEGTYDLVDEGLNRTVRIRTFGNTRLVVWNPGTRPDLVPLFGKDGWRRFLCVEPAVIPRGSGFYLEPGERRSIGMTVSLHPRHPPAVLPLPGEACTNAPLPCAPFPDRMSAFVWRNWFCVPKDRLAETVGASVADLVAVATEMGLPAEPDVSPRWRDLGYVTVLRRNWHLLNYGQLLVLLGWDRAKLRYHLLYDDYLFSKLGNLKPTCGELRWNGGEAGKSSGARKRIAAILKEEGVDDFTETPRFAFVDGLSRLPTGSSAARPPEKPLRISSGYYADCLDPLWDDEIASFSEGILARYAAAGVNGVWLHVVLNTLAKDPFFVEFGDGAERRQRNLRKLVDRAAKYGIKVYLYFNEPRPMPPAFFEKNEAYRACRGTTEWNGLVCAMCLRAPEVRRWLASAIGEVFRAAPGLGGVFTISASENLVHCLAHGDKAFFEKAALREPACRPELFCPRCEKLGFAASAAALNTLVAEAVRAADPSARVFVWDWGWTGKTEDLGVVRDTVALLPTNNVSFLTVSARGKPLDVDGTMSKVNEYTLSQVGPSEVSRQKWAMARAAGLGLAVKAQASGSWEIASVPYVPVMDNVAAHAYNLMREGVADTLLSWTCGTYPAPNLKVFNGVRTDDAGPEAVLERVSAELYGPAAAPAARKVWTLLSKGFSRYPFTSRVLYHGPHHMGPANPLYLRPTGYAATMTGIPYDDLDGWRRIFPRETYVARFRQMAEAFAHGAEDWKDVVDKAEGDGRRLAEDELGIIRTIALNFASTADQAAFVMARERGDRGQMSAVTVRELARARELLPLVRRDARLGYEGASQYFFIPQDLREKVVGCRMLLDALRARGILSK